LEKAGEDGVVASELIPSREARELVLGMLSSDGLIKRRRSFRGERVFITKKGLILLKSMGEEIVS
jgi:CTP-dependent riboflavin kinase